MKRFNTITTTLIRLAMAITFCAHGLTLVSCGGTVAHSKGPDRTIAIDSHADRASFSGDGNILAVVDRSDSVSPIEELKVYKLSEGRIVFSTSDYAIYDVNVSPDGNRVAISGRDGIRILGIPDGRVLLTIPGNQIFRVAFSPDGKFLASGGALGNAELRQTSDGTLKNSLDMGDWIVSLAFNSSGDVLAIGTSEPFGFIQKKDASNDPKAISLWHYSDNKRMTTFAGHKWGVLAIAFSPDGKTIVSGGSDGTVRLWKKGTGRPVGKLDPDTGWLPFQKAEVPINDVAFSPDGKRIAVAAGNNILLLDPSTLSIALTLGGHTAEVERIRFSQDNATVTSVAEDSTVRTWQVQ
jgi:WD40 repeat protein